MLNSNKKWQNTGKYERILKNGLTHSCCFTVMKMEALGPSKCWSKYIFKKRVIKGKNNYLKTTATT